MPEIGLLESRTTCQKSDCFLKGNFSLQPKIKSVDENCKNKFFFLCLLVISCCQNCSKSMNDTEFRKKALRSRILRIVVVKFLYSPPCFV